MKRFQVSNKKFTEKTSKAKYKHMIEFGMSYKKIINQINKDLYTEGDGKNKQIAVFSSPDGGAFKFEAGDLLTTSTVLLEVFSDVVIVKDQEDEKFEVYMNNIIRPSEG